MPEAVVSNNIPMPEGQPPILVDIDAFRHTVNKIEALAYMVGCVLELGRPHEDITNGITYLLQDQSDELRSHLADYKAERSDRDQNDAMFAEVLAKLRDREAAQ